MPADAWGRRTQFQDWSFDDILGHLHLFDHAASLSARDRSELVAFFGDLRKTRLAVPAQKPWLRLTSPSGALWEWNTPTAGSRIEGSAVEFCRVVTQTRNVQDTRLQVEGAAATAWMAVAQCFAGPPVLPPAPGSRYRQQPG